MTREEAILKLCDFAVTTAGPENEEVLKAVSVVAPSDVLQGLAADLEFAARRFKANQLAFEVLLKQAGQQSQKEKKQTLRPSARRFLRRLVDLNMTVTDAALAIGRPRETVSRCIHQGGFPKVETELREALNL